MSDILLKEESYAIVGAATAVANELGFGFLEAVYHEALAVEFEERGIPHQAQRRLPVTYKGRTLSAKYVADFVCFDSVIVEVKTLEQITSLEETQVLNYLNAASLPLGMILNFGSPSLQWRRYARSHRRSSSAYRIRETLGPGR